MILSVLTFTSFLLVGTHTCIDMLSIILQSFQYSSNNIINHEWIMIKLKLSLTDFNQYEYA